MKNLRKCLALVMALAMTASMLSGCKSEQKPAGSGSGSGSGSTAQGVTPMTVSMGSGPSGGNNYLICSGFADLVTKTFPDYTINVEISTGSQENIRGIMGGTVDLCMVTSDAAWYGYNAKREYDGMPAEKLQYMVGGFPLYNNLIVPTDSKVQSVEDLRGMKIGAQTGMIAQYSLPIALSGYGITENDVQIVQLDSADLSTAFQDGSIDAAFYSSGAPQAILTELATTKGFRLLPFSEEAMDKVIAENPFYSKTEIPGGIYAGNDDPTPTLGYFNVMICSTELSEEFVYNFVKTLLENKDELNNIHVLAAEYNVDNTLEAATIPIHPGAEKYYREIGLIK